MNKITEIKAAQLAARKARETTVSTLLTTIIGEAEMIGKSAGNRESTNAEVLQVLKKFEKNQLENITIYRKANMADKLVAAETEVAIIRQFLPMALPNYEVRRDIENLLESMNLPMDRKSLGPITKALKEKYGDQFDGGQVSKQFSEMI